MGSGSVASTDDRGRVLIPKDIRRRVKAKVFKVELMGDGSIVLKPVPSEVLELAGRFKGLLKHRSVGA